MNSIAMPAENEEGQPKPREFVVYFLRLGTFGFGGPIALAGHMRKDLGPQVGVQRRLRRGIGFSPAFSRPAGRTTGDVSRLGARRGAGRDADWSGVCAAIFSVGDGTGGSNTYTTDSWRGFKESFTE
jgi:hypothetical protein